MKRREAKGKGEKEKYTYLNAEFQRIARRDEKVFLSDQCKEIVGKNTVGRTRDLFKKIRDIKGTFHAKMGLMKDRNGMYLTEAEDIKKRWQEYTEELYKKDLHDQDNHDGEIICNRTETQYNYVSTALGLPVLAKPLTLYVTEKDKVAMGVLSQIMGTWDRPVTYV